MISTSSGFGGDGSSGRGNQPCVGICYYHKLKGIVLDKKLRKRMNNRNPCVGLCFINKMKKKKGLMKKSKAGEEIEED